MGMRFKKGSPKPGEHRILTRRELEIVQCHFPDAQKRTALVRSNDGFLRLMSPNGEYYHTRLNDMIDKALDALDRFWADDTPPERGKGIPEPF